MNQHPVPTEGELELEIAALQSRLLNLRNRWKSNKPVKYALESLPALLGRQQLLQLLLVLGLDGDYVAIEKDRSVDPGEWLAAAIAHRAVRADRLRREEDRRLSEDFEQMLLRASGEPCGLSPEAEPQPSQQASSADSPLQ
ncbi:hypothetical protein [Rhizobium sp. 21-4511-3d]